MAEIRRAGPKKIAVITVVAVIGVILAYGNNSTDGAASGRTLPRTVVSLPQHSHVAAARP